ncbi:Transcriptional repressor NF-X1 [Geodia barretti]|nr:Transcriptional repressor NF-X1 [Geodia barretti]
MMLTQHCHCGRSHREVVCGETGEEGEEERYGCSLVCGRELNCGNHLCELSCHPAPCPPCPLLPAHVTACPCGATPLSALLSPDQSRTSCLDPVPTCNRSCGRVLPCSTKAEPHFCPAGCHEGPCPRCEKSRLVRCRCGRGSTRVECQNLEGIGDFVCDKPCNKMKSCGRHRCNTRCCMDANHQCTLVCGKRLRCGIHNCMEQCHRGHCEQCWEYSYEELTCHCGAEILYPPLPCGTRPPTCKRVCARMHSCDHNVFHSCHNEEECPPCTVLTVKMCMGEHEKRYNIPCHIADVSCGMPCGKDLPCGRHKCLKLCHRGACTDSLAQQCRQPCQTPRKYCSHVCGETCHVGSECPDIPCKAEVVLTCKCGRMKERVLCGASSSGIMQQAFHKILSKDLGAKIRDLQSGHSVSLGRVSLASLSRDKDSLDCDEVCAQIERNRTLAEALGITSPVLDPLESPLPKYPSTLLDQARRDTAVAASLEEELKSFVDSVMKSQGPGDQARRHKFQPMANHERRMVHELAPHYGCDSLSYDSEPLRHVTVSTKKCRAKFPTLSLMKMLDKERLKVATPTPVNLPSERGSSPGKISGPLEIERTKTPAVREPVTDYFADNLS